MMQGVRAEVARNVGEVARAMLGWQLTMMLKWAAAKDKGPEVDRLICQQSECKVVRLKGWLNAC